LAFILCFGVSAGLSPSQKKTPNAMEEQQLIEKLKQQISDALSLE
jgi:hypothetical protein